jgi:hypothetical protein
MSTIGIQSASPFSFYLPCLPGLLVGTPMFHLKVTTSHLKHKANCLVFARRIATRHCVGKTAKNV